MFDIYALINRYIIYPIYYWKSNDLRLKQWKILEKQQYLASEELEALQLSNLQNIVKYAYMNTVYYKRIMDERGLRPDFVKSLKDIEKLPILTKDIIQRFGDEMISSEYDKKDLIKDASGGSTGQPTVYYKDLQRHNLRRADQIRHDRWSGWNIGDRSALIWGAQRDLSAIKSWREKFISRYISRIWELDAFEMTDVKMSGFVEELEKIKPKMILGYANALYEFANYVSEHHSNHKIQLAGIISSAETLTQEKREKIESTFKCKVLNRYGSREVGLIASECKSQKGLHINADNIYLEITSGQNVVEDGQRGDVVITDFTNKGMPFIRYRLEDVGYKSLELCDCGRTLPLLGAIEGRTGDFFVAKDGRMIHGEYYTHLFYGYDKIKQFQLIQIDIDNIELKLVTNTEDFDSADEKLKDIINEIKTSLGGSNNVDIKIVDQIEKPKSGKSRFTISHVKPSYRKSI